MTRYMTISLATLDPRPLPECLPVRFLCARPKVKRLVGRYAPHFSGYGQQDCQVRVRLSGGVLVGDVVYTFAHHRVAKNRSDVL